MSRDARPQTRQTCERISQDVPQDRSHVAVAVAPPRARQLGMPQSLELAARPTHKQAMARLLSMTQKRTMEPLVHLEDPAASMPPVQPVKVENVTASM